MTETQYQGIREALVVCSLIISLPLTILLIAIDCVLEEIRDKLQTQPGGKEDGK